MVAAIMPQKSPLVNWIWLARVLVLFSSLLLFSSPIQTLSISTMNFVKEYLLGLFGLLATLASGFTSLLFSHTNTAYCPRTLLAYFSLLATLISGLVPRWVKRLPEHLVNVPYLERFCVYWPVQLERILLLFHHRYPIL
jgi:hypothetical protein